MKITSSFLKKLAESRLFYVILSILSAILIWFILSVTVYTSAPLRFYNIPLEVDLTGTPAEEGGFSVISQDVETVSVQLEGNRSQVGILTQEDLTAVAVVDNVTSSGTYSLDITVKSKDNVKFTVTSVTPSHVNVRFDRIETRTFELTPSIPNIVIKTGHTLDRDDMTCDPPTVDITGPIAQLDQIADAAVYSDNRSEIESTYTLYSSDVVLYTADGSILDTEALSMPDQDYKITIPIMTQKELKLSYNILGAPKNFDVNWLKERLALSDETITIASPDSNLVSQDTWSTDDNISLSDVTLGYTNKLNVVEKEGYINQSGFQQVTVTLDDEGLVQRDFPVSSDNITVIGVPSNFDCRIITKNITISAIGTQEEIEALSNKDILITVDLLGQDVTKGQSFTLDSAVTFSGTTRTWAVGTYKIAFELAERTAAETN